MLPLLLALRPYLTPTSSRVRGTCATGVPSLSVLAFYIQSGLKCSVSCAAEWPAKFLEVLHPRPCPRLLQETSRILEKPYMNSNVWECAGRDARCSGHEGPVAVAQFTIAYYGLSTTDGTRRCFAQRLFGGGALAGGQ